MMRRAPRLSFGLYSVAPFAAAAVLLLRANADLERVPRRTRPLPPPPRLSLATRDSLFRFATYLADAYVHAWLVRSQCCPRRKNHRIFRALWSIGNAVSRCAAPPVVRELYARDHLTGSPWIFLFFLFSFITGIEYFATTRWNIK